MSLWSDLLGTVNSYFKIGLTGVRLKNSSGNLLVRNSADSADAEVTVSKVKISGDNYEINSDAAGSGADWKYTIARPTSGMTAAVTLTLPPDDGSSGQVLQTDGNGVLTWASAGTTDHLVHVDTTTLAYGDSSPKSMFTLPANAVIHKVVVIIDTAFNGTAPTASVGVDGGSASKYVAASQIDLKATAKTVFEIHPGEAPNGSTEDLEIAYSADGSSAGSARFEVHYSNPA
jgi:hypothetical protein